MNTSQLAICTVAIGMLLSTSLATKATTANEVLTDNIEIGNRNVSSWCGSRITAEDLEDAGRFGGDCTASYTNPDPQWDPEGNEHHIIPVVFHVIQSESGTGYLSEQRVQNQVDALNNQFQSLLGEDSLDLNISFVLASQTPSGQPTDGINYYSDDSWFSDGEGSFAYSLGWDQQHYLNIYTFNLVSSGPLGYAYYPFSSAGQWWDGIYLDYHIVGGPGDADSPWTQYDGGDICTHEAGHYFGLHHTFETSLGACDSSGCDSSGDTVCDTNPHSESDYYCSYTYTCGVGSPVRNYMNYTLPSCMWQFTPIQANRIRCAIANYRSDLPWVNGACCWSGICLQGPESACNSVGGVFQGVGSICADAECKSPSCEADIDGNGSVDVGDLLDVIDAWGQVDSPADVNEDGVVNVSDLLIVISNWGPCK